MSGGGTAEIIGHDCSLQAGGQAVTPPQPAPLLGEPRETAHTLWVTEALAVGHPPLGYRGWPCSGGCPGPLPTNLTDSIGLQNEILPCRQGQSAKIAWVRPGLSGWRREREGLREEELVAKG